MFYKEFAKNVGWCADDGSRIQVDKTRKSVAKPFCQTKKMALNDNDPPIGRSNM